MEFILFAKIKKPFLYFAVLYALFGFIALPFILKSQLTKIIEQEINVKVGIQSISFNPFIFKLELFGVELKSLEEKPLLSFKELLVDLELYSLSHATLHIKDIKLLEPSISMIYNKDKTINLLTILKENNVTKEESNSTTEMPRIIVDSIEIIDGKLAYEDFTQATPFEFSFDKIGFALRDVDTNDFNSSNAALRLYTTLGDGGFVDFKSQIVGFKPFVIDGSLDFQASKLYTEWKYAQDILNLEVADGKISFHSLYHLEVDDLNKTKIENLNISLENLRIKPKNKYKDILNLESFYVKDATIMPFKRSVEIDTMGIYGLAIKVKRDEKGTIDWLEYLKVQGTAQEVVEQNTTNKKSEPWSVTLKDFALEKISLNFRDTLIQPEVTTQLNTLNLYAKDITLAGEKPFAYNVDLLLNDKAKCNSSGYIKHSQLDISSHIECHNFDIVHYNPYIDTEAKKALKLYNLELKNASAGFDANMDIKEVDSEIVLKLSDTNMSISELRLNKHDTAESLLGFKGFSIDGINLDTKNKTVSVERVTLDSLDTHLKKYEDGSLNVAQLIELRPAKKVNKKSDDKPFDVKLKHFSIKGAEVDFTDKSLSHARVNKIDRIDANAYNIDLKKQSWLSYNLAMRVNSKGSIKTKGKLRHTPLKQSGTFEINKLSLIELTPYLQEKAYVSVDDGTLSLKGSVEYEKSSKKPDVQVQGSMNLASFFVNNTQDDSLLLSLNNVGIKSYTLELNPNRLYVDEVNVEAFFVNAMIDENKVMNLAKLMKKDNTNESKTSSVEVKEEESNSTFPVRVVKINYALGSAKFADYSIPLKFKTHIHDLNGVVYSVSNTPGDTTYVDISGEVDEYGSTRLKGSIDSFNPKAYTDMDFNFKNLELNSFSGYSATFAGHEIDSGKLYLDLGYDILDSVLQGKNAVMIRQIKLGKEVEDENVTKLPLGFVIGLLEDSDGIIDINMPVEGNLDEPDFKYGKLVLQTIGNLITKAVTSPFKFLGSVMGLDGEALEYISFVPASTLISPPEREKLDNIAKIMLKKPKISLGVGQFYDAILDKQGIQMKKLVALVVKKSGIKNIQEHESVMTNEMLEDIYEEAKEDDAIDTLKTELSHKYKDKEFNHEYQKALIKLCSNIQVVTEDELKLLASQRADMIVSYLTQEKSILPQRVGKKGLRVAETTEEEFVKIDMQIEVK
jgi:hypothetical protein